MLQHPGRDQCPGHGHGRRSAQPGAQQHSHLGRSDLLHHNSEAILNEAQGNNASFNQLLLRAPGVAEDSLGQVHVRGEHANLQYRINDVLLPEGITGFGQELDPRFVQSMQLINGSLPAEYGFRTAGIVDIQTKSGAALNGGSVEMFAGSYDTIRPSFEYGQTIGQNEFLHRWQLRS
jgi:hypothetical protein